MAQPNKTRVQVATDPSFSNIVHDVQGDYTTALQVAEDVLPKGVNLYARGMHGHPNSGDSAWSATVLFKIMVPYANQLYYTAGTHTFTVPAGVTEVSIAATPGVDYSSAGELLKAYTGKTVACVAGNNTVPVGISSITLSGKGADGSTNYQWNYSHWTKQNGTNHLKVHTIRSPVLSYENPPSTIQYTCQEYPTTDRTASYLSKTATQLIYRHQFVITTVGTQTSTVTITIYYARSSGTVVTGAATTAVVNGTTYTFPGGNGGAAAVTNHTVAVNPAIGATINATLASGGSLSYSYSAYAINALSSLLGNNFSLSPVAANMGTYSGGIAAWRNSIPVVPGSTIPVRVGSGGAVNIIWGTGRSFPNSEA